MIAKLTVTILVAMTAAIFSGTTQSPPPESASKQPTAPAKVTAKADKKTKTTTHDIPEWAYDARWYQIDIARFRYADPNGESSSSEAGRVGTAHQDTVTNRASHRNLTGNIAGLKQQLPYLAELGVNTLYLAPIFRRVTTPITTNAFDMRHVSDELGAGASHDSSETWDPNKWGHTEADRTFIDFVEAAHVRGFRIILAAPFGEAAWHSASVASTTRRVLDLTRRWMDPNGDGITSDGVDGWVVTEPDPLPKEFWIHWRLTAKQINPAVLFVIDAKNSETRWDDSNSCNFEVDSGTASAILRVFSEPPKSLPLKRFAAAIAATWPDGSPKERRATPTLIGGTRYGRLRSRIKLNRWPTVPELLARTDSAQSPPNSDYDEAWRLALILHYFLPGAPVLYFGEEVGMLGQHYKRSQLMWSHSQSSKNQEYRPEFASLVQWLNFRRSLLAPLRRGSVRTIMADDDTGMLVFARTLPDGEVVLAMNLSKTKRQVAIPAGKPGELAHILTPELVPSGKPVPRFPGRKSATGEKKKPSRITPLRLGGIRQFVSAEGKLSMWVGPQSIRVILLGSASPSKRPAPANRSEPRP